jgi:hypothetical protein
MLRQKVCHDTFITSDLFDKLTVTNFVDGFVFLPCQFPILIESVFFEEESNFVA